MLTEQKVRVFLYNEAFERNWWGKRGPSPDKGKGVRSDVSLRRCPASTLDQRVRLTLREEDTKEAKLMS